MRPPHARGTTPNGAIAQRRQQVADLYLQGWTQCEIAEHVRVIQA